MLARCPETREIVETTSPRGLLDIQRPDVQLVVWRRATAPCLRRWLETVDMAHWGERRFVLEAQDASVAVLDELLEAGYGPDHMARCLARDVADVAAAYAEATGNVLFELRLEHVTHDACWKFHRDHVHTRMLVTYAGPGTQWVPPEEAARALRRQKSYRGPLHDLQEGEVALFKGECCGAGAGIVHRSPPIAGTGQPRLLLVLSPPPPEPRAG